MALVMPFGNPWQLVAIFGADDIARHRRRMPGGNKIEGRIGVIGAQIQCSQVARAVNTDAVGGGGIESCRGWLPKV